LYLWETKSWTKDSLSGAYLANIVAFLPTKSILAFAGDPGESPREERNHIITILDVSSNNIVQRLSVPDFPNVADARGTYVQNIEWLSDGQHLLSLQTEGTGVSAISLWNIENGEMLAETSLSALNS